MIGYGVSITTLPLREQVFGFYFLFLLYGWGVQTMERGPTIGETSEYVQKGGVHTGMESQEILKHVCDQWWTTGPPVGHL